jgi:steroid delta-isomerase-like uncharacterized protein
VFCLAKEEDKMSVTNVNANSELTIQRELHAAIHDGDDSSWMNTPRSILQSALAALNDGRIAEAVALFDERFNFKDHALDLEFTDKLRLTEFFQKSRELFPDATLEVLSLFASGDQVIAEWKLAATQIVPFSSIGYRIRINLAGSTIVRVEDGRIVQWSDYYDQVSSRRTGLASFFADWIEY